MNSNPAKLTDLVTANPARIAELFRAQWQSIVRHTDALFCRLMIFQLCFGIGVALWLSPRTWVGTTSHMHPHVWLAIFLGSFITSVPVLLTLLRPGKVITRHVVAVGQMLMSALLIHLTGGRIETHFHVFGSLAILAFYRDWPVLISASLVVVVDHLLRGIYLPESVYGVSHASVLRSFEHAAWVAFEVVFLIISIRKSHSEMLAVAERQAALEATNENIEQTVATRTAELTHEILERRQMEERLRQRETQLAQAQQIAHLGSWEWDLAHDHVSWSEETRQLYGYEPAPAGFTMVKCLQRIHPDDQARVQQALDDALETRRPFICDHRIVLPGDAERTLHCRGEIIVNEQAKPVKMFGVVQDITEAKRAGEALRLSEEQLRQAQKMEAVGRLAGGVAHDFNNLLTVINGYCAMGLQKTDPSHPMYRNAEEILKAAERAGALTRQLLAFSRKQVLQPRVLHLNQIVEGMGKMLRRLIGEDVEFHTRFDSALGQVRVDPGQMEQVILNLAVNARDAMPHGGRLAIRTANVYLDHPTSSRNRTLEAGSYVMLSVSDNGVGMTAEVKAHLFEPFFTTKGIGKGTGLGLATCYGIITQSGGDIRVYSEPAAGTTFKIYLPTTDVPADHPIAPESKSLPGGAESLLVVEDDTAVRSFIASVLVECGYRVQQAGDPLEALPMIENDPSLDLVITDVIMPRMNGKDLYEKIRERNIRAKVLFISGYTDDALADLGVLGGDFSFLEKPFSPASLARKIREVLDETSPAIPAARRPAEICV